MLTYEEAVRSWGVKKLSGFPRLRGKFDEASVSVDFEMDPGFACCGGSNPECYCSLAESPSMKAHLSYTTKSGRSESLTLSWLDLVDTLREIVELSQA